MDDIMLKFNKLIIKIMRTCVLIIITLIYFYFATDFLNNFGKTELGMIMTGIVFFFYLIIVLPLCICMLDKYINYRK